MYELLFLSLSIPSECYIPFWQSPPPIPVNVEIAGFPFQMAEPQQPLPEMQYINTPMMPQIKEEPRLENPWLSMIKTVASVMNNSIDWEREKSRMQDFGPVNEQKPADVPLIFRSPRPSVNSINERGFYKPPNAGLVRLLSSMPRKCVLP